MEIATARLVLRPFRDADLADLVAAANDPRVAEQLRDRFPHPYDEDAGRRWLAAASEKESLAALAVTLDGRVVGGIGLDRKPDVARLTAEIGYWLGSAYWGRGYATEAVAALVRRAFAAGGVERIEAWVFAPNERSRRVLEKCGFRREGTARRSVLKRGRLLDSDLYARLRGEDPSEPG